MTTPSRGTVLISTVLHASLMPFFPQLPPRLLWEIRVSDSMEVGLQAAEEVSEMMVVLVEGASTTILEALVGA